MSSLSKVKEAIRSKYAWPGGYPLYLVTYDGFAISIDGAKDCWRHIVSAHLTNDKTGGWYITGVEINWEDQYLYCDATGNLIECAYNEGE